MPGLDLQGRVVGFPRRSSEREVERASERERGGEREREKALSTALEYVFGAVCQIN